MVELAFDYVERKESRVESVPVVVVVSTIL